MLKHAILCDIPHMYEPDEDEMRMRGRDNPSGCRAQLVVQGLPLREGLCPVWTRTATASSDAASSALHVLRLLCILIVCN